MLYDKIQTIFHLKLRAKLLYRALFGAPPSFSAHKNLWTEISITLALETIDRKLPPPPLPPHPLPSAYNFCGTTMTISIAHGARNSSMFEGI